MLSNWAQSSNNIKLANFAVSLKIAKRGKPFTDGEYVKNCFIRESEELFRDFKNKAEVMKKKIKDLPLSAKTVQDRTDKNVFKCNTYASGRHSTGFCLITCYRRVLRHKRQGTSYPFLQVLSSQGPKEELL
ncbi:hypothetical protein AVEN_247058-1 [Araneus ventricosus]|uniref:Uncharacterized protein n=1 Tax=Araneus ventricosus TaxID=182803 RepID=A0A4Y2Q6C0_ARAVE|nr:hypothetical protein AVEN_247058-1 [Araneus ventricosus]